MSALAAITGLLLGAAAGTAHLAVSHVRAALAVRGRTAASIALLPVGFAAIAAAVIVAAHVDRRAAWLVPVGIFAARFSVLRSWMNRP